MECLAGVSGRAGASNEVGTGPRKEFFWVNLLAVMPGIAAQAATAEMMSGSDCAQVLPIKSVPVDMLSSMVTIGLKKVHEATIMDPPTWRLCGRFILLGTLKLRTESRLLDYWPSAL